MPSVKKRTSQAVLVQQVMVNDLAMIMSCPMSRHMLKPALLSAMLIGIIACFCSMAMANTSTCWNALFTMVFCRVSAWMERVFSIPTPWKPILEMGNRPARANARRGLVAHAAHRISPVFYLQFKAMRMHITTIMSM